MSIKNNLTIENSNKNIFLKILKGSAVSVIITIFLLIVFALLLAYTGISENIITPIIICISGLSIIIGSIISCFRIRKQGLLNGAIVGFIYIFVIYFLSSIIQNDFGLNFYSVLMIFTSAFLGALGGIIGVNIKKK